MQNILKNIFYLSIVLKLLVACSTFQTQGPVSELDSLQNQRASGALLALQELEDVDTLIKLNNKWLANHFETELRAQSILGETYKFQKIKFTFLSQIITLDAIVDIKDENENTITASLTGDILLKYRENGLVWQPHFSQVQINSRNFTFANGSYSEAVPELTQTTLENLNKDIAQAVVQNNRNSIKLNPVPLGEIQIGASLPGFAEIAARNTQSLRGVFMIAGSAVLIESSVTSVALDLTFIPDLSTCPADVTVSRAEFTSKIDSREPVGIARDMSNAADVNYFFSEISGAIRPLTIIHYWFEDGFPRNVEELAVGPSERWRTWSSKGEASSNATHWEVLVVEKESGCILASKSIHVSESEPVSTMVDQRQARQTFTELKDQFNSRISGFATIRDEPGIALVEVRRAFLRDVIQDSLTDLSIDAEFDGSTLSVLQSTAQLQPFDSADIVCEYRECPPAPICNINQAQCKRLRDTRDCSSCQFRNPLNNRCVSQAIDPLCESARNRQNARYENQRNICMKRAEDEKRECERLNAQVLRSCQIESGFEDSVCESTKTSLKALSQSLPLAFVNAQANSTGTLSVNFSNFLIVGDLQQLKLDMNLLSGLQLQGELNFKPVGTAQPLAKCIAAWDAPFNSRFSGTPAVNNMVSDFEQEPAMLTARWSGFGVTVETQPSPLESVFVENPQLLADCKIGLTVNKVEKAIAGDDAEFFLGKVNLLLQPLPTKIHLAPASIEFGNMVYSADAYLSDQNLKYDIHE
ncbi:DUF2914 domain-containing protein [Pseudomonadota bacterium]